MLFNNSVLRAIHDYGKNQGWPSSLNVSPRVGVPCVGATPNVTIGRVLGVRCDNSNVRVYNHNGSILRVIEMCDPAMMDKLTEIVEIWVMADGK